MTTTYVALDSHTGSELRPATEHEAAEYRRLDALRPVTRRGEGWAIRIGSVSVDERRNLPPMSATDRAAMYA